MVREALAAYAEIFRDRDGLPRRVDERMAQIYERALADIPELQLKVALEAALRTCKFFPTPADIREHVAKADRAGLALEAERAWQAALHHAERYYFPDFGLDRRAPEIDAKIEHAAQAAGGWRRLHMCPEGELVWCRKAFLEAYGQAAEAGESAHLLTHGKAKRILASLRAGPRALPVRAEQRAPEPDDPEGRARFLAKAEEIAKSEDLPSHEELHRRAAEQKRRQQDWLAKRSRKVESVSKR